MYNYYVAIILHQITNCIYYQFNVVKPIINHPPVITINLGKLQYFTNLNSSAIWGSFPLLTMIPVRENSEVVIIYPDKWVVNMALFSPPASTGTSAVPPALRGRRPTCRAPPTRGSAWCSGEAPCKRGRLRHGILET
jgi:hypothetical protein